MMNLYKGRRLELLSSAVIYLVGALVTAVAPDLPIMVIGRFVFGIGIGLVMHSLLFLKHTFIFHFLLSTSAYVHVYTFVVD